ncbi:hypothetical protein Ac2012v2_003617 [Leucoagaricus gongylophorus]
MDLFLFPHLAPSRATTHVALFLNVKNASNLRKRIVSAVTMGGEIGETEREQVNYAFIDARLITSRRHLQTAVHQSILAETHNGLRTRTVHSEVLWNLSPTNSITETIRWYGVSDTTKSLLVVRIDGGSAAPGVIESRIREIVQGELVPLSQLQEVTDWSMIKKQHRLANEYPVQTVKGNVVAERSVIDNIVTSTVAMKSVMG